MWFNKMLYVLKVMVSKEVCEVKQTIHFLPKPQYEGGGISLRPFNHLLYMVAFWQEGFFSVWQHF